MHGQALQALVTLLQGGGQRGDVATGGNGFRQVLDLTGDAVAFGGQSGTLGVDVVGERLIEYSIHERLRQDHLFERIEEHVVDALDVERRVRGAHGGTLTTTGRADVDTAHGLERRPTRAGDAPGQQVFVGVMAVSARTPEKASFLVAQVVVVARFEPGVHAGDHVGVDQAQMGRVDDLPQRFVLFRLATLMATAIEVALFGPVVGNRPSIQRALEDGAHRARVPSGRASTLRTWRRQLLRVERMRDGLEASAIGVTLVDVAHDVGFGIVNLALDVTILADVRVAEGAAACDVALCGSTHHRFMRFLRDAAAELGTERAEHQAGDVVLKRPERELLAVRVEPHLHARLGDALQFTKRLIGVTTTEAVA